MNRLLTFAIAGALSTALVSAGCQDKDKPHDHDHMHASTASPAEARASGDVAVYPIIDTDKAVVAAAREDAPHVTSARAEIEPSKAPGMDDVKGVVTFTPAEGGLKVHYAIKGLTPASKHGFHIHEKGDLSAPDLTSAGGHFNPGGHKHGGPTGEARHGGDLGNITADDKGVAEGDVMAVGVTLDESKTGILGRSVVVHEKADDLATDPSGNSGARIGAGVIKGLEAKAPQGEKDANNATKQDK